MFKKMDRKRVVAEEIRHHRGQPQIVSPDASKRPEGEKYPWEIREEIKQYEIKRMIATKPGQGNKKETLLSMDKGMASR